jgi:IS1 family transposase
MRVCTTCQSAWLINNGSAAGKSKQSKATTHDIECNHYRQCYWFGRFKRKSTILLKSEEMVDLTIALFAKFWVNGNQGEVLSLLP